MYGQAICAIRLQKGQATYFKYMLDYSDWGMYNIIYNSIDNKNSLYYYYYMIKRV